MSVHYDLVCPGCGVRVGGCRCAATDKRKVTGDEPCAACRKKPDCTHRRWTIFGSAQVRPVAMATCVDCGEHFPLHHALASLAGRVDELERRLERSGV